MANLGGEPDPGMRKPPNGIEKHLDSTPGRCLRREVEHLSTTDRAEPTVDVCLLGQLFFDETDPKSAKGALQDVEPCLKVHF